VFATGRTRPEWIGTGLMELGRRATWAAALAGRATGWRRLEEVPDPELLTFVKWLRLQLGRRVEAAEVDVALGLPGVAVALTVDDEPAALCVDACLDAALERALVGLVQRLQHGERRDERRAIAWLEALERDLPHDLPDEAADWSGWTPAALTGCADRGLDVVVQPREVDAALLSLGLGAGWVGLRRR